MGEGRLKRLAGTVTVKIDDRFIASRPQIAGNGQGCIREIYDFI